VKRVVKTDTVDDLFANECRASGDAPRLAAWAALLEIADRIGIVNLIATGNQFEVDDLCASTGLPAEGLAGFCEALEVAALIRPVGGAATTTGPFVAVDGFERIQHQAGFLSWTLNANRPFIENAREFLDDPGRSSGVGLRDGREVAVSSQWMGSNAFYPAALRTILERRPKKVVDLGSGTCRLLIEVLRTLPECQAVGLDLDPAACREARESADRAQVGDRLTVLERPIQSIADEPGPLRDADAVHGGFVFHDMMPEEESTASKVLLNCCQAIRPGGIVAITDAVPYVKNERERQFSAIVTYYHRQFMKRKLLTEAEWTATLHEAGFKPVEAVELAFHGGRLFIGHKSDDSA
jgi:SAM-dependent methyltransferase